MLTLEKNFGCDLDEDFGEGTTENQSKYQDKLERYEIEQRVFPLNPCNEVFIMDNNESADEYFAGMAKQINQANNKEIIKRYNCKSNLLTELKHRSEQRLEFPSQIFFSSRGNDYGPGDLNSFITELKKITEQTKKVVEVVFMSTDKECMEMVEEINQRKERFIAHIIGKDLFPIQLSIERAIESRLKTKSQGNNEAAVEDKKFEIESWQNNLTNFWAESAEPKTIEEPDKADKDIEEFKKKDKHAIIIDDDEPQRDLFELYLRVSTEENDFEKMGVKSFSTGKEAYQYFEQIKDYLTNKNVVVVLDGLLQKDKKTEKFYHSENLYLALKNLLKKEKMNNISFVANSSDSAWNNTMINQYGFIQNSCEGKDGGKDVGKYIKVVQKKLGIKEV